jgi:hypothetical protein
MGSGEVAKAKNQLGEEIRQQAIEADLDSTSGDHWSDSTMGIESGWSGGTGKMERGRKVLQQSLSYLLLCQPPRLRKKRWYQGATSGVPIAVEDLV